MSAAWPRVVDRLVDWLPTLPGWAGVTVYDGPPVTADTPRTFVTVGFVEGEDFGGSYEQTHNGETGWEGALEESGTVRCELVQWTGDNALRIQRGAGFALVDAWQAATSADQTLGGVLGANASVALAVDVQPVQNQAGSAQRLTVTVSYLTCS